MVWYGACPENPGGTSAAAAATVVTKLGTPVAIRQFMGASLSWPAVPDGCLMHRSYKPSTSVTDAAIDGLLTAAEGHLVTFWHEPDNDELTPTARAARIALMNRLYDRNMALGSPCIIVPTFTGGLFANYTDDSERDLWFGPSGVKGDLIGIDCDGVHDATAPIGFTYVDEIDKVLELIAENEDQGFWGWTIPEFGTGRPADDTDGTARATWMADQVEDVFMTAAIEPYAVLWYDYDVGVDVRLYDSTPELDLWLDYVALNGAEDPPPPPPPPPPPDPPEEPEDYTAVFKVEDFDAIADLNITVDNSTLDFAASLKSGPEYDPPLTGDPIGKIATRNNSNSSGNGGFTLGNYVRGALTAKMLVNRNNPAFTTTPTGTKTFLTLSLAGVVVGQFRYAANGTTVNVEFVHPDPGDIDTAVAEVAHVVPISSDVPPDFVGYLWRVYTIDFSSSTQITATVSEISAGPTSTLIYDETFDFPGAEFEALEVGSPEGFGRFDVWYDITGFTGMNSDCAYLQFSGESVPDREPGDYEPDDGPHATPIYPGFPASYSNTAPSEHVRTHLDPAAFSWDFPDFRPSLDPNA